MHRRAFSLIALAMCFIAPSTHSDPLPSNIILSPSVRDLAASNPDCFEHLISLVRGHLGEDSGASRAYIAHTSSASDVVTAFTDAGLGDSTDDLLVRIAKLSNQFGDNPVVLRAFETLVDQDRRHLLCIYTSDCSIGSNDFSRIVGVHEGSMGASSFDLGHIEYLGIGTHAPAGFPGMASVTLPSELTTESIVELAATTLHEVSHGSDDKLLNDWLLANMILAGLGLEPDQVFQRFVVLDDDGGILIQADFHKLFTEGRSHLISTLTRAAAVEERDKPTIIRHYSERDLAKLTVWPLSYNIRLDRLGLSDSLNPENLYKTATDWGTQMEKTKTDAVTQLQARGVRLDRLGQLREKGREILRTRFKLRRQESSPEDFEAYLHSLNRMTGGTWDAVALMIRATPKADSDNETGRLEMNRDLRRRAISFIMERVRSLAVGPKEPRSLMRIAEIASDLRKLLALDPEHAATLNEFEALMTSIFKGKEAYFYTMGKLIAHQRSLMLVDEEKGPGFSAMVAMLSNTELASQKESPDAFLEFFRTHYLNKAIEAKMKFTDPVGFQGFLKAIDDAIRPQNPQLADQILGEMRNSPLAP